MDDNGEIILNYMNDMLINEDSILVLALLKKTSETFLSLKNVLDKWHGDVNVLNEIDIFQEVAKQKLCVLQLHEAPEVDGICRGVLQNLATVVLKLSSITFAGVCKKKETLRDWKMANITPVFIQKRSKESA